MLLKIHKRKDQEVIALCDKVLIGKIFEENNLKLDINENFYKGKEISKEEIYKIIKNASNVNIVGKKSISWALKNKLISKSNVIQIKSIPHAQIVSI